MYNNGIVNLPAYTLSSCEESLLAHGLGFCLTTVAPAPANILLNFKEFKRKLQLYLFFQNSNNENNEGGDSIRHPLPTQIIQK